MLKFLGTGSSFNPKLGNNCAYIKKDNILVLFDCGETVFERIKELNLIENVNDIRIFISHTHSDHIGSLTTLISYCYYIKNIIPKIYFKDKETLKTIFKLSGVESNKYTLNINKFNHIPELDISIETIKTIHTDGLNCFGFMISNGKNLYYYSGDSKYIPDNILNIFIKGYIDKLYQDVSSLDYDDNVHLSFNQLIKLIPENLRNRVYCMHLDELFNYNKAKELGFNIVKNEYEKEKLI